MESLKRLGFPLLLIIASAFITKLLEAYARISFLDQLLLVISVISLFMLGVALHAGVKSSGTAIFRKVFGIVITILLLFMQLGYFEFPQVDQVFSFLGIHTFYLNLIYVYCGYLFME